MRMVVKFVVSVLLLNALFSCENGTQKNNQTEKQPTIPAVIYFSDLVDVSAIDSVIMENNSGKHPVSPEKLDEFIEALSKMTLNNGVYKMGSIGFYVYIKDRKFHFAGRTNGQFVETTYDIITKNNSWVKKSWLYFETNGFNLDNY